MVRGKFFAVQWSLHAQLRCFTASLLLHCASDVSGPQRMLWMRSAVDATGAQDLHLPLAPDGAAAAFGIIVEQAADCCIVKVMPASCRCPRVSAVALMCSVLAAGYPCACPSCWRVAVGQVHCKDRPRLLLDTASALAELQLQVATFTSAHASTDMSCLITSLLAI